jgi:transposase
MTIMTPPTRRDRTDAAPTADWSRRPEALTARWEDRSACYNRPQEWWDGDDPKLTQKARAACVGCPVLAECLGEVMQQERSVIWSRAAVRGGLTGAERVQLFLDQREHGPYDAEEARLLALEARAYRRPVADVVDSEVSVSTLRLAERLAGEKVPVRKPPSATELRGGTAKERAFGRAQDILEWREAGMTVKAIAAELRMGRDTIQDVLRAFTDLAEDGDDPAEETGELDPRLLAEFLADYDTVLPLDMQVLAVAEAVKGGMSYPDIDKARQVSRGYTASFVSRQRKRYEREGREFPVKPVSHRVLADEQVLEMRERYTRGGVTDLELALHYGVPRNVVSGALSGRNYKHVGGPIRERADVTRMASVRDHMCGHAANSRAAMNKKDMGEAA